MFVVQDIITLAAKPRGFHLVTQEILQKTSVFDGSKNQQAREPKNRTEGKQATNQFAIDQQITGQDITGLLHILLMHTSASISLNENADPSVRQDFETFTNTMVPENFAAFVHTYEGRDDMPAHIKSSMYGATLCIPVQRGALVLGTWQGIYLNEHRNYGGARRLVLTLMGSPQ